MITVQNRFRTSDGTVYDARCDAESHEKTQLKKWVESNPSVNICDVLDSFKEIASDEYYGTERNMAMKFVERSYELSQIK